MKHAWLVVVTFISFFLTSCSDLREDQNLVLYQIEKTSQYSNPSQLKPLTTFSGLEIKEWKLSHMEEGIHITFGSDMDNYDFVFAVVENSEFHRSELVFLKKVQNEYTLPNHRIFDVKDIRVYGIFTSQEIGNYPYRYLQDFLA